MTTTARFKKRFYFLVAGYFRFFANFVFRRWHPRVIAITGSVGKTTMLNLLEKTLKQKAHYSHNANSAFGISFDLTNLRGVTGSKLRWLYLLFAVPIKSLFVRHSETFYVVEIDGERPHEAEFLARWLRPEVTLWVSLGRSHAVQFESQVASGQFTNIDKAIAHEFAMLPQYTTKMIYIDSDVPLMVKAATKVKHRHALPAELVLCSKSELTSYEVHPEKTTFTFIDAKFEFSSPQPADLTIQLVMLKKLVKYLKLPLVTDFNGLNLAPGRCSFFRGKNGLKLIDSTYNAHLISMASILKMAKSLKAKHKWLIIGDIVDQGSLEKEEHTKLADLIAEVKPEQVVLVGRRTKQYTAPRLKKLQVKTHLATDVRIALDFITTHATGKETLIFKGSQYLEWLVEQLLLDPLDARLLPRREKAADKRRQKRGLN